jgi:hypothetical protein
MKNLINAFKYNVVYLFVGLLAFSPIASATYDKSPFDVSEYQAGQRSYASATSSAFAKAHVRVEIPKYGYHPKPAPVPVPAGLWLLGSALAAFGAIRRRGKNDAQ